VIVYEHPLSERVRTLLRLEDLFDRIESTKDLNADDEKALVAALEDFQKNGAY
jgi:cell division protein ZapD